MKNFLIYKSSAGSGKTYTLVKEYLKLVLKNPDDFRHTLAITFTNKAADEMRQRVIEKIIDLSENNDPRLEKILSDEGVRGDIKHTAKIILNNILHKYSCFAITTIDSFFHRVIKSFARELNLHLGFNLEMDTDMVMDKVVDDLLNEIGVNKDLTEYLEDYIFFSIDDEKGWKIDTRIKDIGKEIFKERYWERKNYKRGELADNREKMKAFISEMFAIIWRFENSMIDFSEKACGIMDEYSLVISDFKGGENSVASYISRLKNRNIYGEKEKITPTKTARKIIDNGEPWYKKDSLKKQQIDEAVNSGLGEQLEKIVSYYDKNLRAYVSSKELIKTIYILGIFKDLLDKLKAYRDENKIMIISDLNNILKEILSDENDSPFIYEKIGTQYKNYLVDEFQDTSNFQWYNLLPLIKNSLSEQNFSMIVGDVKQSIYRWRSGNMKLLLEKVEEDLLEFKPVTEERLLNDNRRSRKEITRFNNAFFGKAPGILANRIEDDNKNLITEAYKDIKQNESFCSDGGYVNITFTSNSGDSELKPKEIAGQKLLQTINETLNDGFGLKDIMILVRNNADGSDTARLLIENNIKVISNESLLLINSPKVKLLINLLKYVADNNNHLARTEILFNYLVYIKESGIDYNLIFNDYRKNEDSLFQTSLPVDFFSKAGSLNSKLNNLTLYELIENLVMIFGLNNKADAYLLRFLDAALEYSQKNNSDIISFLEWWEDNRMKCSIIVPAKENAVQVMTIHGAKGLQSPVVIIPYANWEIDINSARDLIWVSSDEEPFNSSSAFFVKADKALKKSYFEQDYIEECILSNIDNLNLVYVAFTRAIERLYIFCPDKASFGYHTGKLIQEVINSDESIKSAQKEPGIFEIGLKEPFDSKEQKSEIYPLKPDGIISSDFRKKVVIKSQNEYLKISEFSDSRDSIDRGVILHKALSYINKKDDIDLAVSKIINDGLVTSGKSEEIKKSLKELINIPVVSDWFSDNQIVKTESEILLPDGRVLRPDRVIMKDDKAIVVDYKSGREKKEHSRQVTDYADALIKAGYKSVEKYILYINEKKLVKI